MTTRHNVDVRALHARTLIRLNRSPRAIHPLTPEEAFFMARMIEYVNESTTMIQDVIDIIENDTTAPSEDIQRAHMLLIKFRGKQSPQG